jgi:hypothetical protein
VRVDGLSHIIKQEGAQGCDGRLRQRRQKAREGGAGR